MSGVVVSLDDARRARAERTPAPPERQQLGEPFEMHGVAFTVTISQGSQCWVQAVATPTGELRWSSDAQA